MVRQMTCDHIHVRQMTCDDHVMVRQMGMMTCDDHVTVRQQMTLCKLMKVFSCSDTRWA